MLGRSFVAVVALICATTSSFAAWTATPLYNFSADAVGYDPRLGVVIDSSDQIYGSAYIGGVNGGGTIYQTIGMSTTVLYSFTDQDTAGCGYSPSAILVFDSTDGSIYGTTFYGGARGGGVVYHLTPGATWTCTPIHNFSNTTGRTGGYSSFGGLLMNAAGDTLYGVTQFGGETNTIVAGQAKNSVGGGVVFQLVNVAGKWNYTVLHRFTKKGTIAGNCNGSGSCTPQDGYTPSGALAMNAGLLYGTTFFGGKANGGTVYVIDPTIAGNYNVLHAFSGITPSVGRNQGYQPTQGRLLINAGVIYGETALGGGNANKAVVGGGVIYKLTTAGAYTVLHYFDGTASATNAGYSPYGGLISVGANLYGVTQTGGVENGGTVFRLTTAGAAYTKIYDFSVSAPTAGYTPSGGLAQKLNGNFVGTTASGGTGSGGVLFELQP